MKRAWALIPAAALGISLAACGSSSGPSGPNIFSSPSTTQAADPALNWTAIGQQDGIAAEKTPGLNITYDGTTATTAYAWCADIMFNPQPASLDATLKANHLPAAGTEAVQWNAGCEKAFGTAPAAAAPAPASTKGAAPLG